MMRRNSTLSYICLLILIASHGIFCFQLSDFNCPALPPHKPKNISDLRPDDIKVVMALGDSITAGFGMEGLEGTWNEFRGQSWSIGGDSGAVTLANFLNFYNPNVVGASLGYHKFEFCQQNDCPDDLYQPEYDVFDAAQSGAMTMNLAPHELNYLINQLINNPNVDILSDWKVLTILIGANDLCWACTSDGTYLDPDEYENHLFITLEMIRLSIPRTFVNLVPMFNLSQVYNLSLQSDYCDAVHRVFYTECDCIFQRDGDETRKTIDKYVIAYNQKLSKLESYYKSMQYEDFAAVVQPFLADTMLVDQPLAILSTLDCFHPSVLGHQHLAIGLWNSMLMPAAKKPTKLNMNDVPMCPTAEDRFYTW